MTKDGYAIGGMTMVGIGVGFFLFHLSVFYFIGSIMAGIGIGLFAESLANK